MKSISMLELRLNAEKIIAQVQGGERLILTRRGKPVARLEPIGGETPATDDPFYALGESSATKAASLTNKDIDESLYGS